MAVDRSLLFLMALCAPLWTSAQGLLQRKVDVEASEVRLSQALTLVAVEAGFKLSYNAAAIPVDSIVQLRAANMPAEQVLRGLLGPSIGIQESGQHVILVDRGGVSRKVNVSGTVVDAESGAPIGRATIYEVRERYSGRSDGSGRFELEVSGTSERTALLVARTGYNDTVVYVDRNGSAGRVQLKPRPKLEYLEARCVTDLCGVEATGVGRLLLSSAQVDQAANLSFIGRRTFQFALIPRVGTNGELGGAMVNRISFNLIGGYARGLEGFEFGGGFNMERRDVKGFQFAGGANLVGGSTNGVQIAGGANHTMRSLQGVQVAGGFNNVWDTLSGVQVAGGANLVRGRMKGMQVAGGVNIAMHDMEGTQIAGGLNLTVCDVKKGQISGGMNFAQSVSGGQFACGANVVPGPVSGGQVSFGMNYAHLVDGGQFTFGLNAVPGPVSGGQVAFGMNYAHSVDGGQFAFGMNAVPGRVDGGQVAFGMNYAHHVQGGQFALGANAVPGTVERNQFAVGLNYAHRVHGAQVGFGLNVVSDTIHGAQVGVMNVAKRAMSTQVGVLNICDTIVGIPFGVLTIIKHGYHRADIESNDVTPMDLSIRTGVRRLYNILRVSAPLTDEGRWGFGWGFGSEPRLGKRTFLNVELTADQIMEQHAWRSGVNLLGRFRVAFGYELNERWVLHAGPLFQMLISDLRDAEGNFDSTLPPASLLYDSVSGRLHLAGWIGASAGFGLRF